MRFETFVALRYLRGKRKNRFISLISMISVAGVSVGVITLIVVMSVMTGFDNALRDTIIGNRAHFTVMDGRGYTMVDYESVIEDIEGQCPEILASGPFIQVQALLENKSGRKSGTVTTGAYIIGVDPERESHVTQLAENLTLEDGRRYGAGRLPGNAEIVLGYGLADHLGVRIGDWIGVFTKTEGVKPSPFGPRPAQEKFLEVCGISHAKMSEFDTVYAWVDLETAQMLTGRQGVDGIHCKIENPFMADAMAERLRGYRVVTWYENQMAFFEALRQEKLAMFIILVFIVLVAAFNITSTLIMMVMEKQRDIGILRTIGTSGSSILKLFMAEGLIIGLSGTVIGVVCGTILAYNLNPVAEFVATLFGVDLFNSQIYYFDQIPVDVVPRDVFWITVSAVVLSFFSTLYPAWSASRLDPVEALRYE